MGHWFLTQDNLVQIEKVAINDLLDFDLSGADQADHVQVGHKADSGKKRGGDGPQFAKQSVGVFGMVHDNDLSAGFADPEDLPAELQGITDRGDHVRGDNGIKGVVGEGHVAGIHDLQVNGMSIAQPGDPFPGPIDHPGRNVDPDDMTGFRVMAQGQTRPDPHFQHFSVGPRDQGT